MIASSFRKQQNSFHHEINSYFSGTWFSNFERFLSVSFNGEQAFAAHAGRLVDLFRDLESSSVIQPKAGQIVEKNIQAYEGGNPWVSSLQAYITDNLSHDVEVALVHGSLATSEEINYSDLDVLIVLKNAVLRDAARLSRLSYRLLEARKILVEYDPLIHHGFFILTELDFDHYSQEFLPLPLFDHSKSLFPESGSSLRFRLRQAGSNDHHILKRMLSTVKRKVMQFEYPENYYDLKLLLSQVLLLPALYLQARGQYVFKRYSFDLARQDFTPEQWEIMDTVSDIRQQWDFRQSPISSFLQASIQNPFYVTLYQKRIGQRLSSAMRRYLTESFYSKLLLLVLAMESQIEGIANMPFNTTDQVDFSGDLSNRSYKKDRVS